MNREQMIDDAATAGARAMRGATAHVGLRDREFAAAALAVFEEAHAPTEDEREALARTIWNADNLERAVLEDAKAIADAILAAGFRRTVQGEPSERSSFDAFGEPRNRAAQELQAQGDRSDDEEADPQTAYGAVVREYAAFRRDRQEQMTRICAALDDAYVGARTGNLITPHWVVKSIDDTREAGGWTLPPNRPNGSEDREAGQNG
ncbi:hypothetical protein PFZ55_41130 [Streptomyces sp. MS2A]|nr:hypothetical protein [Streptomyces sp. MS2A]